MNPKTHRPRKPRLLGIFAHPDDETFCAGGTLARHVDQGGEAMVVSFTKGQRGQIRDPGSATRVTLGAVREQELYLACQRLGVRYALCLDYMDGSLSALDPGILIGEVVRLIRAFQPDTVLTFDLEGGYGHPDHIAISNVTTQAFYEAGRLDCYPEHFAEGLTPHTPSYLHHSVFVRQETLLGEELATWLRSLGERYRAPAALVSALPYFAADMTTMGYARDEIRMQWYPPGISIVEPGEIVDSLFLILSGQVDLIEETGDGQGRVVARRGAGEFLGATSLLDRQPSRVHAVASDGVACLVLARERPSLHTPRGANTWLPDAAPAGTPEALHDTPPTTAIDVSPYVEKKIAAMQAHRTQYPFAPDLLPASILHRLMGTEHVLQISPPMASETPLLYTSHEDRDQGQAA